jgi:hypothetical protein
VSESVGARRRAVGYVHITWVSCRNGRSLVPRGVVGSHRCDAYGMKEMRRTSGIVALHALRMISTA